MTGLPQPALHPSNQPRSTPPRMTVSLFQTSLPPTAIAAHCIILCGQPLQHHRRVHHRVHRAHGRYVPALITLALPISPRSHLHLDFLRLQKKRRALQPLLPSLHVVLRGLFSCHHCIFPQPFCAPTALPFCPASTPCPSTSTPPTGIPALQCLKNFRVIRIPSLQPNPNSQICPMSSWRQ